LKDSNPIFKLEDISFSYLDHRVALSYINLEIYRGESIVILGPNGSGKTTLLKILDGIISPTKGIVLAFGERLDSKKLDNPEFNRFFRKNVVLLFQDVNAQLFSPTVEDEIAFGLIQLDYKEDEIKKRMKHITELFRISELRERSPYELSGGEKKKVALASILVIEPEVIILDEPTEGLDPRSTREMVEIIKDLHRNEKTLIIATHSLDIASEISDRIYVLGENKSILKTGTCESIFSDEELLKEANLIF
jgi:cobalt/nickel transport system ATP-binding protein